jgi:hypothetical protein
VTLKKKNNKTIETKGTAYDTIKGRAIQPGNLTSLKIPISLRETSPTQNATQLTSVRRKHPINNTSRHAPKTSQILMRSSVKKPSTGFKRHLKISGSIVNPTAKTPLAAPSRLSVTNQQVLRNQRAASFKQSELINHFRTPPMQQAAKPLSAGDQSWQPAPQTTPAALPKSPTDLLLERAINQATPHEQPTLKGKSKWHRASLITIPIAAAAIVLFIGGHGLTRVQLRVASAEAGFHTSLPAYQPAGFGLSQLSYSNNIFSSEFHSKNGAQSYTVTQESTPWDSQGLLDNYVITNSGHAYQTVHVGDRTIYLYGVGDATWVNGGIWYQINSDGSLNNSQLIGVANSL